MCKTFQIAKDTVKEFIQRKEPFYYHDLQQEIINRNGVLRIAPGVSIASYLRNLERRNIIFYNQLLDKFDFVEFVEELQEERFDQFKRLKIHD